MDIFTREKLNHLSNRTGQSLISLFMPTHRVGREMQQDPIRFKNLLAQAKERLKDRGMRKSEIDALLKRASALQIDAAFWQNQSDGLALFIAPDFMESYRLPIQFSELLMISDRFYLKPLLPLLSKNGRFYILALSQKQIRLLDGSLFNIDEVTLENVPTSLSEALWFDDPEK